MASETETGAFGERLETIGGVFQFGETRFFGGDFCLCGFDAGVDFGNRGAVGRNIRADGDEISFCPLKVQLGLVIDESGERIALFDISSGEDKDLVHHSVDEGRHFDDVGIGF